MHISLQNTALSAVIAIGLVATTAGTVQAGTLDAPNVSSPPVFTEISRASTPDWTGPYVGAQIGYGDVNASVGAANGDGIIGGIIAGYDFDMGDWVLGVGLDYDFAEIDVGTATTLENILRVKARGGRKVGSGLIYGTAGYAHASTSSLGSDGGFFVGAGYEQRISDRFSFGAEVLYHEFSSFNGSANAIDATTVHLRGIWRF
ncbi:outer membrane beta-barrel protein [Aliiroseovarius sp. KMU-50]|uniref:Outer membrane beta-barrel protein n=1 Tax=Aliiroseovarius salicola TaxID=3009082 RepID=A0ABT4W202_9RHOB|nr:outer membrane beta-barrel protein [Aliiroseovarius sp. KMU-50]MDA5093783.1 outer membrane beta-barrel protein [Aliiroseovarius sp. KMU-50]